MKNNINNINEKVHVMDLNTTQATTTVHKMQSGIDVHQRFLSLNKGEEKFWGGFHFRIKALQGSECKHLMKNEGN